MGIAITNHRVHIALQRVLNWLLAGFGTPANERS